MRNFRDTWRIADALAVLDDPSDLPERPRREGMWMPRGGWINTADEPEPRFSELTVVAKVGLFPHEVRDILWRLQTEARTGEKVNQVAERMEWKPKDLAAQRRHIEETKREEAKRQETRREKLARNAAAKTARWNRRQAEKKEVEEYRAEVAARRARELEEARLRAEERSAQIRRDVARSQAECLARRALIDEAEKQAIAQAEAVNWKVLRVEDRGVVIVTQYNHFHGHPHQPSWRAWFAGCNVPREQTVVNLWKDYRLGGGPTQRAAMDDLWAAVRVLSGRSRPVSGCPVLKGFEGRLT